VSFCIDLLRKERLVERLMRPCGCPKKSSGDFGTYVVSLKLKSRRRGIQEQAWGGGGEKQRERNPAPLKSGKRYGAYDQALDGIELDVL